MYIWKFNLQQQGLVEASINTYNQYQIEKQQYVEQYLSPSVNKAECGWNHCKFIVFNNKNGEFDSEYLAIYPGEADTTARYVNVTANSIGCIAQACWSNIFN